MIRLFLILLLFPVTWAIAYEPAKINMTDKCKASKIFRVVTEQLDSVSYFDGEKLYLKPENIHQTNVGWVLLRGQSAIFFPTLSANSTGHYILCRSSEDFQLVCSNSFCGNVWWFSDTWDVYCQYCGSIGN